MIEDCGKENQRFLFLSAIDYSMVDFLFVDSQRNESVSSLFSIDSQGFLHTLTVLDRELQANYTLSIVMYDRILKSYSLPTNVAVQILDENDNLPFEPFLANPFELSVEQINDDETVIYEFQPIDLDDGPNGMISIDCLNCTGAYYFHLSVNNATNATILITKPNVTVPDGAYTLAFVLRDHGLFISRERLYTLKFNLTHRLIDDGDGDERTAAEREQETHSIPPAAAAPLPFLARQKNLLVKLFSHKFEWRFLILLIVSWLVLVLIAIWTCYSYNRISRRKRKEKEQQEQFEIQVRQHEVISQPAPPLPKSASFPLTSHPPPGKETLTHEDDEIEDTSYDADHIITDANFVLTSGCAVNDRYVSCLSALPNEPKLINASIKCRGAEVADRRVTRECARARGRETFRVLSTFPFHVRLNSARARYQTDLKVNRTKRSANDIVSRPLIHIVRWGARWTCTLLARALAVGAVNDRIVRQIASAILTYSFANKRETSRRETPAREKKAVEKLTTEIQ